MSRISLKRQEVSRLKYIRKAAEISGEHHREVQRLKGSVRSGATEAAKRNEFVKMGTEIAQARAEIWLDDFRQEGLIPNNQELDELCHELEKIVESAKRQQTGEIVPLEKYMTIVPSIRRDLIIAIKEMELEREKPRPVQLTGDSYSINIHGDSLGAIQQGGENNNQTINPKKGE